MKELLIKVQNGLKKELVKMSVLVVGPGAIGTAAAASLAKNGVEVFLLGKEKHKNYLLKNPLVYHKKEVTIKEKVIPLIFDDLHSDKSLNFGAVLFTLKSNQTIEMMNKLAEVLPHNIPIVSLQNGLIAQDIFKETDFNNIYAGVINYNVKTEQLGVATQISEGNIITGKIDSTGFQNSSEVPSSLVKLLSNICPIEVSDHINEDVWMKVLINSTINPICTIGKIPLGEIARFKPSIFLALWTWRELTNVVDAQGMKLGIYLGQLYPEVLYSYDIISYGIALTVMGKMFSPHKDAIPSMLQDVINGRKTEIDFLNGRVYAIGQELNVDMPVNKLIIDTVKQIENGEKTPSKGLLTKLYRQIVLQ